MDKPSLGHSVPMLWDGRKWLVDLEELKNSKITGKPMCCYTASITSQVLQLHEHMGHPAMEAMSTTINSGSWLNSKLTADQVRCAMSYIHQEE